MKHKTKKITLLIAGITLTSLCTIFAITACSKQKSQPNPKIKPNKIIEKIDQLKSLQPLKFLLRKTKTL